MASPTPRRFVAPAIHCTVSTLLSFCVIFSLLLQPVAAISVTYPLAVALTGNASATTNRSTSTPDHALKENPAEAAVARPATSPKVRTLPSPRRWRMLTPSLFI